MSLRLIFPLLALACAAEVPTEPVGEGTEIGEEGGGLGECSEARTTLGGPDAVAPGFDHSVAELTERWDGTFTADGATLTVTTDLSAPVYVEREPPADQPGTLCTDTIEVPATVGFSTEDLVLETPAGTLEIELFDYIHVSGNVTVYDAETGADGISDDGVEAIPNDPGTLSATAGPETLARSEMSSIVVRIDANGDPDGWFTRAIWRGIPIDSETWQDEDIWIGPMPAD